MVDFLFRFTSCIFFSWRRCATINLIVVPYLTQTSRCSLSVSLLLFLLMIAETMKHWQKSITSGDWWIWMVNCCICQNCAWSHCRPPSLTNALKSRRPWSRALFMSEFQKHRPSIFYALATYTTLCCYFELRYIFLAKLYTAISTLQTSTAFYCRHPYLRFL